MEKRKPHYRLPEAQAVVADPESQPFTVTALRGGTELGLTEQQMRDVVLSLTPSDFYKSMTTIRDSQVWQDVYHGVTQYGDHVDIKITSISGRPPIIQFKAK